MTKWVNVVVIYSRYTKRQVIVSLRVITKVFLLRHSNVSLENRKKLCIPCRKKIMQMPGEVPVEQSISSPPHKKNWNEKQWHNMSRCFVNCTPDMSSSLLQTTESIYVVSLLFRTLIFLPIFEWDIGLNTFLITHINAVTFFLCILNWSQQIYSFFSPLSL